MPGARLALDQGQTRRSVALAERLLRQLPAHCELDRPPGLELLIRARIARSELEEACSALEALRKIERLVGTVPLRAAADVAEGLLAAAGGDHERARTLLVCTRQSASSRPVSVVRREHGPRAVRAALHRVLTERRSVSAQRYS